LVTEISVEAVNFVRRATDRALQQMDDVILKNRIYPA
jgi:hypothetical protein